MSQMSLETHRGDVRPLALISTVYSGFYKDSEECGSREASAVHAD